MATLGSIPSNQELITGTNVTLGGLNLASLYPDPGVDKPTSLKVTQRGAGANMSVDVAAGSVYVPDGSSGINLISKASTTNLTVSNGAGGGIRHDFVTIDSDGTLSILEGTVDTDPTPASNTHVLARIRVPQSETTSIDDADIDDKREYGTVFRRPNGNKARATHSSDQNDNGHNTSTNPALDTTDYDVGGFHSETTNNSRMTIPEDDRVYSVGARIVYDDDASGDRLIEIQKNGSTIQALTHHQHIISTAFDNGLEVNLDITLAKDDFVEIRCRQGSGGTRVIRGIDSSPILWVRDIGGLDKPTGSEGQ